MWNVLKIRFFEGILIVLIVYWLEFSDSVSEYFIFCFYRGLRVSDESLSILRIAGFFLNQISNNAIRNFMSGSNAASWCSLGRFFRLWLFNWFGLLCLYWIKDEKLALWISFALYFFRRFLFLTILIFLKGLLRFLKFDDISTCSFSLSKLS